MKKGADNDTEVIDLCHLDDGVPEIWTAGDVSLPSASALFVHIIDIADGDIHIVRVFNKDDVAFLGKLPERGSDRLYVYAEIRSKSIRIQIQSFSRIGISIKME